jgi:hypothetical protein
VAQQWRLSPQDPEQDLILIHTPHTIDLRLRAERLREGKLHSPSVCSTTETSRPKHDEKKLVIMTTATNWKMVKEDRNMEHFSLAFPGG